MVTVRYWAGAQAAAGHAEEKLPVKTLGELLDTVGRRPALATVFPACSLLLCGATAGGTGSVRSGATGS